jgi:hypothetical protein
MKHLLFLTLICAFNTVVKAQNAPLKIGFLINPTYSDRFKEKEVFFQGTFVGQYAYSIGVFGQKSMNHSLNLRFGASLVNNGEHTKRGLGQRFEPDGGFGLFIAFPNESFEFVENHYNIELPIEIQWFMNKKRSIFTIFGASPGYNYSKTVKINNYLDDKLANSNTFEQSNDKGISVALQAGIGYQMRLNQSLLFEIQPKFRYYITRAQNTHEMYNIGLQMNIIY